MLGLTVDNASNNNVLVETLGELDNGFAGAPNHVRCFAHIINLVAKTVLRQFDVARKGDDANGADADDAAALLGELVAGIDVDGLDEDDGIGEDDDVDGWVDERTDLSEEEREELRESVLPVKLVLAKVSASLTWL